MSEAWWSGSRIDDELRRSRRRVNGRSNGGGSLLPHWRCLFFHITETKTGLNLQLNPWPAFDLVSGTGGGGQRAGRRGGCGCEMGACCCFEVPPRIWKRPIKQDYKKWHSLPPQTKHSHVCPLKNPTQHPLTNIPHSKNYQSPMCWHNELQFCW